MKNWFKTNTDSSPKDKKWWKPNISWLKLDKWVKRLDIYIIKKFLGTYFFAIALIISIAVVFDVNENIDRFINNKAPLKAIVFDYYMNFIPYFSNLFSPLFVFIAVIFFTSKLAENSEIIAMFSTGMSFKRMMRPYMISAAIISVVTFGLGAYVIPKGNVTRLDFEDRYKKKKKQEYVRNVQLEVDSGVIAYIERYENYNKTGYRFSLDKFDDKKLVAHLTARSVTYDTASVHKWTIKNYMIREMEGMREKITRGDRLDTIIKMEPQDFLIMKGQQQTMTSPELKEYIDKQKRRGFANIKEFEIEYYQRIAMSFAACFMASFSLMPSATYFATCSSTEMLSQPSRSACRCASKEKPSQTRTNSPFGGFSEKYRRCSPIVALRTSSNFFVSSRTAATSLLSPNSSANSASVSVRRCGAS